MGGGENGSGGGSAGAAGGGTAGQGGGAGGGGGSAGAGGGSGGGTTSGRPFAYVGSSSNIYVYELSEADGGMKLRSNIAAGSGSSFLAVHPSRQWLYAVNEGSSQVASFSIDGGTGGLKFINRVGSGGAGPAHLSVEPSGRFVLVANYVGGTVAVLPILDGGALGTATDTESPGSKAHQIVTDKSGQNVFVPCLGSDLVAQYDFNGSLTAKSPASASTATGAGPRHIDLHPNGKWAYLINEVDRTMSMFEVSNGKLTHKQTLTTVPAAVTTGSTAEVWVHPAGHSVYGSNRGHNSIVHFSLDANGRMTLVGHTPTGGMTPRSFTLNAAGTLLLVANQDSGNIVAMRVNLDTGALTSIGPVASVPGSPAYVGIVSVP